MNASSSNVTKTCSITVNLRQLELLTALLGGSSPNQLLPLINDSSIVSRGQVKRTTASEINKELGYAPYNALKAALDALQPVVIKVVEFVYDKRDGSAPTWRTVHVTEDNSTYVEGLEDGLNFKRFLKTRIVGGRIITK